MNEIFLMWAEAISWRPSSREAKPKIPSAVQLQPKKQLDVGISPLD